MGLMSLHDAAPRRAGRSTINKILPMDFSAERIQNFYAGFQKIDGVACDKRQSVPVGDGRDLAGGSGDHMPCRIPFCFQLAPDMCGTHGKREDAPFHTVTERLQPVAQFGFPSALRQPLDASPQLADCDRAHVDFPLVFPHPRHDPGIGLTLCRFAEDIRIHEKTHKSRGLDESRSRSGISNGAGQAKRRSASPLFAGRDIRRRVMVFSSSINTSKSSPGERPSSWRIGTGSTIWPFWERMVVMNIKFCLLGSTLSNDSFIRFCPRGKS